MIDQGSGGLGSLPGRAAEREALCLGSDGVSEKQAHVVLPQDRIQVSMAPVIRRRGSGAISEVLQLEN